MSKTDVAIIAALIGALPGLAALLFNWVRSKRKDLLDTSMVKVESDKNNLAGAFELIEDLRTQRKMDRVEFAEKLDEEREECDKKLEELKTAAAKKIREVEHELMKRIVTLEDQVQELSA